MMPMEAAVTYGDVFARFIDNNGRLLGAWHDERLTFAETGGRPSDPAARAEIGAQLRAIETSGARFRLLSLGAAPGEWAIRGERAHRMLFPSGNYGSLNVEADPHHVEMIYSWFKNHDASLRRNAVVLGSVTARDGWSYFPIIEENDWGARTTSFSTSLDDLDQNIFRIDNYRPNFRIVRAFSIPTLIDMMGGAVDFLHSDVQGAEMEIFRPAMKSMNDNVRMCCVSTHSRAADAVLRTLFTAGLWPMLPTVPTRPRRLARNATATGN
jgi:FkbM family methyltransferase